jgi:hypothetical protein
MVGIGFRGVYVNSSIMNEGVLVKRNLLRVEDQNIPIDSHYTNLRSLMMFPKLALILEPKNP